MTPIEKLLHDTFIPFIREMIGQEVHESSYTTRVKFVKFMRPTDEVSDLFSSLFHFMVEVKGPIDVQQLVHVADLCDEYCTTTEVSVIGDYEYTLGDGDDGGAVQYDNGQFCIWLRGRKFQ